MEDKKQYIDDEIQVLGANSTKDQPSATKNNRKMIIAIIILVPILITLLYIFFFLNNTEKPKDIVQQHTGTTSTTPNIQPQSSINSYIVVSEETVNDVPLFIYTPKNAFMELATEMPDQQSTSIIFVAEAADIRADNGEIVGDYVLNGKQLARGQRKEGFCSIINKEITIGIAPQTEMMTKAIDENGYFFRQYPLVKNSQVIENEPKGKSIRRALAIRNNEVIMVESRSRESFHDFAQALVDIGVTNAIYICGGSAFGWYRSMDGNITTFGQEKERSTGTNYLVWKSSI